MPTNGKRQMGWDTSQELPRAQYTPSQEAKKQQNTLQPMLALAFAVIPQLKIWNISCEQMSDIVVLRGVETYFCCKMLELVNRC